MDTTYSQVSPTRCYTIPLQLNCYILPGASVLEKATKWREVSHFLLVFQIYALKHIIHRKRPLMFSFLTVMEKAYVMPVRETGCKVCLNDVTKSTHLRFPVIISIGSVHLTALF
jgi:hypothetical protein